MTETKNIQVEEKEKEKSVQKPMGKRYPQRWDALQSCRHFIFTGKTRLTLEEYLSKFFRISHRRKDHLTIITLKKIISAKKS